MTFSYWNKGEEVDILIEKNGKILMAIECKSGRVPSTMSFKTFERYNPGIPVTVASLLDEVPRSLEGGVRVLPWRSVLDEYGRLD